MQVVAEQIRKRFPVASDSRRLFHGRGHCFPGYEDLLIDWFNPIILVSLYQRRDEVWLAHLVELLRREVPQATGIILQQRYLADGPVKLLAGEQPQQIDAVENGLRFRLRLGKAQNIGFFPDMATGRSLTAGLAAGRKVLNLFAYSCSFSVCALVSGAERVVNLDMNRGALELGRFNHQLNGIDQRKASFLALELFRSIGKLRRLGPFDLVICDPPAYQGKSFKAERDWPKLLRRMPDLLAPGGDLVACLNGPHLAPEFLTGMVAELLPEFQLRQQLQPGEDFPESEASRGVWIFHYRRAQVD